ncbi:MAG: hypothetical protein MZW92_35730 [Comamonadaceae bacterium]|nr:hypothetical protein [Comamonadaceae bacterium]
MRHAALAQPDLAPRFQIGGDAGEGQRQVGEVAVDEMPLEELDQPLALDQTALEADVEQRDDVLPGQGGTPGLQRAVAVGMDEVLKKVVGVFVLTLAIRN